MGFSDLSWAHSCSDDLSYQSFSNSRLESICGMLIGLEAEGLEEGPWCAWSFISLLLVLWWTCVKTSGTST